ncbi:11162_t:CDS:1, partial [Gigaspora rosea]
MSCSCPSSNICTDYFYSAEENSTNANSLSTRQICKYCNKDAVDLVNRLKEHLNKCNSFPFKLRELADLITSKARR